MWWHHVLRRLLNHMFLRLLIDRHMQGCRAVVILIFFLDCLGAAPVRHLVLDSGTALDPAPLELLLREIGRGGFVHGKRQMLLLIL